MMPLCKQTPCECEQPGYCQRHGIEKPRLMWLACQRDLNLFKLWDERGKGSQSNLNGTQAVDLPRCAHRGLDATETVDCELCGNRLLKVFVYPCRIHGLCTERRFGNSTERSRTLSACTQCDDHVPAELDYGAGH